MKGVITGGPMTDPPSFTNYYADYFYYLGLIDEEGRTYMKSQEKLSAKLMSEGKLSEAQQVYYYLLMQYSLL